MIVVGAVLIVAGGVTWFVVKDQLGAEKITVSDDAAHFAGEKVDGPLTAFAEANAIREHALTAGGGKTYAELPQDDPARSTVMTASFLRASLFTSVVSFGVAAFAVRHGDPHGDDRLCPATQLARLMQVSSRPAAVVTA